LAIEGLDMASGLRRVANKPSIYVKLLRMFVQDHAHDADLIRGAIAVANRELALRALHTLKGVSGNIGAVALSQEAGEVEELVRQGGRLGEVEAALTSLERHLVRQQAAVRAALAMDSEPEPALTPALPPPDPHLLEPLRPRLLVFRQQVVDSDGAAGDTLLPLLEPLRAALGRVEVDALEDAINHYDFDRAQSILDGWLGES